MTSLSIDLRSRQQQIEMMRAELQRSGGQAAAQKQQHEQASVNLMERLAIAQTISADTQVCPPMHLLPLIPPDFLV